MARKQLDEVMLKALELLAEKFGSPLTVEDPEEVEYCPECGFSHKYEKKDADAWHKGFDRDDLSGSMVEGNPSGNLYLTPQRKMDEAAITHEWHVGDKVDERTPKGRLIPHTIVRVTKTLVFLDDGSRWEASSGRSKDSGYTGGLSASAYTIQPSKSNDIVESLIRESLERYCSFYKAKNNKWYMELADEEYGEHNDATTYGPFTSFDSAQRALDNFSNPGGYEEDDSGTRPVPTKSPNGSHVESNPGSNFGWSPNRRPSRYG